MATLYDVLGVAPTASAEEIRAAYLQRAREGHPDRFLDAAEKSRAQDEFQKISEAFQTLSNAQRRQAYDGELAAPQPQSPEQIASDAFARGVKAAEARQDQEAVDLLKIALHHQPEQAQYHLALAQVLARHPAHARDAIQALERAVQLKPANAAWQAQLAVMLSAQGLKIRARKVVEMALRTSPADPTLQKLALELGLAQQGAPGAKLPASPAGGRRGPFGRKG
jgi:curved DNA-binding protein CbpA